MIKRRFSGFSRFLLFSFLYLLFSTPVFAVINLASSSTTWTQVLRGNNFDPAFDAQSTSSVDLFGTSVSPHYYMKYDDGGSIDPSDDEIAFRFRVVQTGGIFFNGNIWVGLDVDSDNDIDAFVLLNSRFSFSTLSIYDTGISQNNSPALTSNDVSTQVFLNDGFAFNYTLVSVIDSLGNEDNDEGGAQVYYVSYKIKVTALLQAINQQTITNALPGTSISTINNGIGFIDSSAFQLVVASGQSPSVLNGDFAGYNDLADNLSVTYNAQNAFSGSLRFINPTPINAYTQTTLITSNVTSILADGLSTATIIIQLKDRNGINLTQGGVNVALTTTNGVLSNVIDNLDGTYRATLTSSTTPGGATIQGTLNESAISDVEVVSFSALPADATTSQVDSSPASIIADGLSTSTITVQLKDSAGNNLISGGDTVVLTTSTGSLSLVVDNNDGTYTAILTSANITGIATINATLNTSQIQDNTLVSFVADSASPAVSTLAVGASSIVADGVSSTTILIQLKDSNGNNLTQGGDTVLIAATIGTVNAVIDNANGTYSANLISAVVAGDATITAMVNGEILTATERVSFVAGNASVITSTVTAIPISINADGVSVSIIMLQLNDTNGNALSIGGDSILISSTLGSVTSVIDNNDGSYSARLTSGLTAGLALVTATLNGNLIADTADVAFIASVADAATSRLTVIPGSIIADGVSTTIITVQLKDRSGANLVQGGDTVTLNATLGSLAAVVDNGDGTYSATLTSATSTGISTITGNVNGRSITSNVAVTFAAGIASTTTSELMASSRSIIADGVSTSIINVQLKDSNGNSLDIGSDSVVLSTSAGSLSSVIDNQNGTYTATLTSATSVATANISAMLNGSAIIMTINVQFKELVTLDTDNDGITNDIDLDDDNDGLTDLFEGDGVIDSDGDGIFDSLDLDSDGDGISDLLESRGMDVDNNGLVDNFTDINADGYDDTLAGLLLIDLDTDADGVVDRLDLDSDNDGLSDVIESAGVDPDNDGLVGAAPQIVDVNGVAVSVFLIFVDNDADGVFNHRDLDSDNDGIPDVLEVGGSDAEGDGILGNGQPVVDAKGRVNGILLIALNTDGSEQIDPYDLDADNDGLLDLVEAGGNDSDNNGLVDGFVDNNNDGFDDFISMNPLPLPDSDFDGIADFQDNDDRDNDDILDSIDLDDDNDGIPDALEGAGMIDTDGDGIADSLDLDSDNDGMFDLIESGIVNPQQFDVDNNGRIDNSFAVGVNGLADIVETFIDSGVVNYNNGMVIDTDDDGVANFMDLDSDNDGITDVIEAGGADPDGDGIAGAGLPAVNPNGLISGSGLPVIDTDTDGVPNYIDLDSDNDGLTGLVENNGLDADLNGMIDGFVDQNNNGFDDVVEANPQPLVDSDGDGIPDYIDAIFNTNIDVGVVNNGVVKTSTRGIGVLNMWVIILLMPIMFLLRCYRHHKQKIISISLVFLLILFANKSSAYDLSPDPYKKRMYIGFSAGQSLISPDTSGTIYTLSQDQDSAGKVFVGMDFTEYFSSELSFSDLGTAKFKPTGEIDYSVIAINFLYYLYDENIRDHNGWSSFIKTGLSTINNTATISFEQKNSVQVIVGFGISYGWSNGVSARIELESYDEDAAMMTVGLVYRFGKVKHKIVFDLANDKDYDGIINTNDRCPGTEAGRKVDNIGCELDTDGDGIKDAIDECPQTPKGLYVEANGCL